MKRKYGFTLIELLVVVSIIALLVSILLPALSEARRQGKLALDQANLHQIGVGLIMYAGENNSNFPRNCAGEWLFDVSYSTSNYLIASGGDKRIFYCPLEGVKNPDTDIFWRMGECSSYNLTDLGNRPEPTTNLDYFVRVTSYFWLFGPAEGFVDRRPGLPMGFRGSPARTWVTKSTQRYAAETEFVVDITISDGLNLETAKFYDYEGGLYRKWGVYDQTAHLSKDKGPRDGHCLYVDGHVFRKPFDEMEFRYLVRGVSLPCQWW